MVLIIGVLVEKVVIVLEMQAYLEERLYILL